MRLLKSHQTEPPREHAVGIGDECSALFDGRHLEFMQREGWVAHPASWLNAVAHGDRVLLEALAREPLPPAGRAPRTWFEARALLAHTALAIAPDDRQLADLQQYVLMPMELELFGLSPTMTPRRLVELVNIALFGARRADVSRD